METGKERCFTGADKSANRKRSEDYENSSSKAIDSLLRLEKENSKLQSELSFKKQCNQAAVR